MKSSKETSENQPRYVKEATNQLLENNSLFIFATGLDYHAALILFLSQFFQQLQHKRHTTIDKRSSASVNAPQPLILILNTPPDESKLFIQRAKNLNLLDTFDDIDVTIQIDPCSSETGKRKKKKYDDDKAAESSEEEQEKASNASFCKRQKRNNVNFHNKSNHVSTSEGNVVPPSETNDLPSESNNVSPKNESNDVLTATEKRNVSEEKNKLRCLTFDSRLLSQPDLRQQYYSMGGVFFCTSRIIVTDMLTSRLPVEILDGLIINHADQLPRQWNLAFVLRLFRQKNKRGFIKGISDRPDNFCAGPARQTELIMKALTVTQLHLYPRFHDSIVTEMKDNSPTIEEINPKFPMLMHDIYTALLSLLKQAFEQICRTPYIDFMDFNLEDCCFKKSFDSRLKQLLIPIWQTLSPTYRQLCQDVGVFRKMLANLTKCDSVQFLSYVVLIRYSRTIDTRWMLTTEWDIILKRARERVYRVQRLRENKIKNVSTSSLPFESLDTPAASPASASLLPEKQPFLDDVKNLPNDWSVPNSEDIHKDNYLLNEKDVIQDTEASHKPVLDNASRSNSGLAFQWFEAANWKKVFFPGKLTKALEIPPKWSLVIKFVRDAARNLELADRLKVLPLESGIPNYRMLILTPDAATSEHLRQCLMFGVKEHVNEIFRDFIIKEANRRSRNLVSPDGELPLQELLELPSMSHGIFETCLILKEASLLLQKTPEDVIDTELFQDELKRKLACLKLNVNPTILIHEVSSISGSLLQSLWEFDPHCVLLMEPDLRTIRTLEMYLFHRYCLAPNKTAGLLQISDFLVQILVYKNSVEHQQYLSNIQAEEAAWSQIIQNRQHLVVPLNETYIIDDETFLDLVSEAKYKESSRKAGGQTRFHRLLSEKDSVSSIVIDTREFRSSLPFQIHCRQIKVVPLTLLVGDYVLSREICVERKSVPDFISSLNSGRLFDQASELIRHYADPSLLIEFSGEGGFAYKSREWIFAEAQRTDTLNRLCLLILTLPKIRLLWSPGSYFTANLFILLKEGREQPDSFRAAVVGSDKTDERTVKMQYASYRLDFLQKLPGITSKSVNILIRHTPFLASVATMDFESLQELLGATSAKEVQKFLDTEWTEVT